MPKLFFIGRYVVFFWSNEKGEPIHVHICEGRPSPGATKIWLTSTGGCVLANNASRIPAHELEDIFDVIEANYMVICRRWKEHFQAESINFFC